MALNIKRKKSTVPTRSNNIQLYCNFNIIIADTGRA